MYTTAMFSVAQILVLLIVISAQYCLFLSAEVSKGRESVPGFDGVALILARGGSKGIPRKNLVTIAGSSLIGRAIKTINESGVFQEIWVSTEDPEIGKEAENYGAKVFKRSQHLAHDGTPSIEAVQEFIQGHPDVNSVALFQCTSIFLRTHYIHQACRLFQEADCVFAATRDCKLRWTFDSENNYLKPINFDPSDRPRRQDWDGEIIETGMFYFAKRELLLDGTFQNERCKVVLIEKDDTLELDDISDLKYARYLLE